MVATSVGILVLVVPVSSHASFPGRNGWIAYQESYSVRPGPFSTCGEGWTIGLVTVDGRQREIRSSSTCDELGDPAFSPSGSRIAVATGRGLGFMDADGGNYSELPPLAGPAYEPAWAPDGRRLVFGAGGEAEDLYAVNRDGTGVRQLTSGPASDSDPAWSHPSRGRPQLIAFDRFPPTRDPFSAVNDIFVMRPDGSGLRRLTYRGGGSPTWSPHGSKLAFVRRNDIYVMRRNGSGLRRLTRAGGVQPAWSPDGRWIVYAARDANQGAPLFVVPSRGGKRRAVDFSADSEFDDRNPIADPDWQPLPPQP
jgi:TolB protein